MYNPLHWVIEAANATWTGSRRGCWKLATGLSSKLGRIFPDCVEIQAQWGINDSARSILRYLLC